MARREGHSGAILSSSARWLEEAKMMGRGQWLVLFVSILYRIAALTE
jgi:hypothetical protein